MDTLTRPVDELTDRGTFRLVDALFAMDGWRLVPADAEGGGPVVLDLVRCRSEDVGVRRFAAGATAGAAALAAYRRYRSVID